MSTAFPKTVAQRRDLDEAIANALAAHPAWGSRINGNNGLIAACYATVMAALYWLNEWSAHSDSKRLPLSTFWPAALQPVAMLQTATWLAALAGGVVLLWLVLSTMREAARWRQAGWILVHTSTSLTETLEDPDFHHWLRTLANQWSSDVWRPENFTGSKARAQHELVLLVLHFRQDTRPPKWVAAHAQSLMAYSSREHILVA